MCQAIHAGVVPLLLLLTLSCGCPSITKPDVVVTHTEGLNSVLFSVDGKFLVASTMEGEIAFWSTSNWSSLGVLSEPNPVSFISLEPASGLLSVFHGGLADWFEPELSLYDVESRSLELSRRLPKCRWAVISQDHKYLAWIDYEWESLYLRNNESNVASKLPLPTGATSLWTATFSPDGKQLVAGLEYGNLASPSYSVGIWAVETGKLVGEFKSKFDIAAVAFSNSGKYLAVGCDGNRLAVYDTLDWRMLMDGTVPGNSSDAYVLVTFGNDDEKLYCGSWVVRSFTIPTKEFGEPISTGSRPSSIAVSPDGSMLAAVYDMGDPTINIWNLR